MEMTEILAISNLPVSATALLLCTDQSTLTGHSALMWVPFLVVSSLCSINFLLFLYRLYKFLLW